ncbi:serine hydrolase domain-containing protein [Aurantiacibacter poecillastricola]|uniref:serine hydrolase domain-containing protein n=1 Tax=Aurantiacibacter poecillastricola TaxID=3064385 RepID=UPI00273DE067|nr:serine hydrolase [Aurantiacibacter sp. 219JJ12-13]MDP5260145.1 serine hydrolase [Aurantiacibacter sp. 219JJ12-13]
MIRLVISAAALLTIATPATAQDEEWRAWDVAPACRDLAPLDDVPSGPELAYRDPSPATISMRRQLLNPEVNAFTFREMDDVWANRQVGASETPQAWREAAGFAMPEGYEAFAQSTFTDALLVARDGAIVFEDYRNRFSPQQTHVGFSMSKTIVAMLIGQALDRGEIESLEDPVERYWPALEGGGYEGATIRNLLEMRSGADIEERYDFGENPSLAACIHETAIVLNRARFADFGIAVGRREAPGTSFNYASLDTAVLGRVLENASGKSLAQLTAERLWEPLGAGRDAFWLADGPPGTGRPLAGMGFNATLRDFARLGQLMLDDGMVGDERVLPDGWVSQMTAMRPLDPESPLPGYGFQTWQLGTEPGAYSAVGLAGQYIYVHPESRTVIVKLSHYPPGAELDEVVAEYFAKVANTPLETAP